MPFQKTFNSLLNL